MRQLELPLGLDEPTDFFVTDCNYLAYTILFSVDDTLLKRFLLIGEASSGKTILAKKWVKNSGSYYDCRWPVDISITNNKQRLALDNVELVEELELMGIVNRCMNNNIGLLMISRQKFKIKLPDLASRIDSSHLLKIECPDKQLVFCIVQDFCFNHGLKIHYKALDILENLEFQTFLEISNFARNLTNLTKSKNKKTVNITLMKAAYDLGIRT